MSASRSHEFESPPPSEQIPASGPDGSVAIQPASLLGEFKQLLNRGEPITAQQFLAEHEELAGDKEAVIDLAYEEYCRRMETGEAPDPAQFAANFPRWKTSLCNLLAAHRFLADEPDLLADDAWPERGQHFQGFYILEELGQGAFARVYLAEEVALGRRLVAIKVSRTGAAEGNILGKLSHPNIVSIHSIKQDEISKRTIVCMPFEGRATLLDVLDYAFLQPRPPRQASIILEALRSIQKGLPARTRKAPSTLLETGSYEEGVLHLGRQLAQALSFVHEQNIFHRDLKPSNVLLTADGRPMLLDFNLAADDGAHGQPLGGTIPYMSPEQLQVTDPEYGGDPLLLDARSDIFSLGVILYELLTGQHPFAPVPWRQHSEEMRHSLLQRQKAGPRALRSIDPAIDRNVAALIERCLEFDPAKRYASAKELAGALDRQLGSIRRIAARIVRDRRAWLASGIAAALIVAAVVVRNPSEVGDYLKAAEAYGKGEYAFVITHCTRALEREPESAKALYLRGKAHQKLGNIDAALVDYARAEKSAPPYMLGSLYANMALALNRRPSHAMAAEYYEKAMQNGLKNAAVCNNLAFSYFKVPALRSKAWSSGLLEKAIELDPKLQAAYFNLGSIEVVRTLVEKQPSTRAEAVTAIRKALDLGPPSGELYRDAAGVLALSDIKGAGDEAIRYAKQAVEAGFSFDALRSDMGVQRLSSRPDFQALAHVQGKVGQALWGEHWVDPAPDLLP